MTIDRRCFLAAGTAAMFVPTTQAQEPPKPRLRRSESFLGMHFDLHPGPSDPALGSRVDKQQILQFLDAVKPDYVQYDCKGHKGWLGYPSKVGPSAPHIVNDSLAVWREATKERRVALYIHFSGVWDDQAVERHPEWAAMTREGTRDPQKTSTFGPYVDELMLPQLKDAVGKYDLDGAWVDGECWAVRPDWGDTVRRQFIEQSGFAAAPDYPTDPGWNEWLEFQRRQFRRYVRHYVDEMHRAHPKVQIASNWLYSTYVPEKPDLPVDFLSGDYLGNAPIAGARVEARYLAQTGKSWDLMAWGFQSARNNNTGPVHKPAVQLEQEAGVVLAQGGGFQIYYQPSREGHLDRQFVDVMSKVAHFCRARQPFCWKTETVPQVAVLYSRHSLYRHSNKLFGGWGDFDLCAKGWIDLLVESHYSVDVLPDWKLAEDGAKYPLIVVPEWQDIGLETEQALRKLAAQGVSMLVAGAGNVSRLADLLGVEMAGEAGDSGEAYVVGLEGLAPVRTVWQQIDSLPGSTILGYRYGRKDTSIDGIVAATKREFGGATLVAVPGSVGEAFGENHAPSLRQFADFLVTSAFRPMLRLEAPATVELVLRQRAGTLQAHLLNTTGMQVASRYAAIDFVAPIPHLKITVTTARPPRRIVLQPPGKRLPFTARPGETTVEYGPLEMYDILEFQGL